MLVVCATALKKIRVVALSVKVFNAIVTNSRAWQHSKPSKGIFSAYISFLISHVLPKLDIWFRKNVLSGTKCTLEGVLFQENVLDETKAGIAQNPDGWSYEHLPVSLHHIGVFRPPRWTILIDHVGRDAATPHFGKY